MSTITRLWGRRERDVRQVKCVLVVEDNDDLRTLLDEVLREAGFEVRCVEHGAAALAMLAEWRPDAIILDIMMPVMDGTTFLQERSKQPWLASIPVLVLTAHPYPYRAIDGLAPTAVLRKPYDLDELISAVQALCEGETGRGNVS